MSLGPLILAATAAPIAFRHTDTLWAERSEVCTVYHSHKSDFSFEVNFSSFSFLFESKLS